MSGWGTADCGSMGGRNFNTRFASPAGAGTALLKTDILFVNLISVIIYKQKFTGREWIDTFVMLFGVLLVMDFDFLHASLGGTLYTNFIYAMSLCVWALLYGCLVPLR